MTESITEIEKLKNDMGYITILSSTIESSYFKLENGTMIKTFVYLDNVKKDPKSPNGYAVDASLSSNCYVPLEHLLPDLFEPFPTNQLNVKIIEEDIPFETIRDNFSVYNMSNGMTISIKPVIAQIDKTRFFKPTGEPIYFVRQTPLIKIKKKKEQLDFPKQYT